MDMKQFDSMTGDQLREALRGFTSTPVNQRRGPLVAPKELFDSSKPELQAAVQASFAAACMEIPERDWTPEMTQAVRDETTKVLSRGY